MPNFLSTLLAKIAVMLLEALVAQIAAMLVRSVRSRVLSYSASPSAAAA